MTITVFEFGKSIHNLNKEKKYSGALKYFKENKVQFTSEQISSNDYLISYVITALRHTGNIDNAFKFMEVYKVSIDERTKEIILTTYGWLLYDKFKAENQLNENYQIESEEIFDDEELEATNNHHYNKTEIIKKIEYFFPLILKVNNDFSYLVISKLFNSVLKVEKKKPNANWKLVNEICDLVSPERLHTDCSTIEVERKGQKKPMELASDKENWFAYKSKALIKLGLFQECYEVSKKALETFDVFHYSNDSWFARRIALSKKGLGNSSDAITELHQVLKKKKEWFIQKELAVLYKEAGDTEKAFTYAIAAINNFGDLEYKIELLFLLGELLKLKQESDLAFKHFSLSQLIRIKEGWNIPSKLQSALSQFDNPVISIEKFQELKAELKKYWSSFNIPPENTKQVHVGKINQILHNNEKGADGRIKYGNNESVYFRINSTDEILKKLDIGLVVEFKIIPATEEKTARAIHIVSKN